MAGSAGTPYARRTMKLLVITAVAALGWSAVIQADVYAYVNDNGDYIVTPDKPGRDVPEYAVLTDDGEFVRLVRPRELDVPITHWRPWFLPKEPDPYDGDPDAYGEREGTVGIEELEDEDE